MKGGYQILDLTGATAGSPVEVKGIYKAAAGNNGKPVLILTNDGQRVYAEIAEDDGDYVTCYISAEGKTVNITIEPDDSVTTAISDPGASITGLEQAVTELNGNKQNKVGFLKAGVWSGHPYTLELTNIRYLFIECTVDGEIADVRTAGFVGTWNEGSNFVDGIYVGNYGGLKISISDNQLLVTNSKGTNVRIFVF